MPQVGGTQHDFQSLEQFWKDSDVTLCDRLQDLTHLTSATTLNTTSSTMWCWLQATNPSCSHCLWDTEAKALLQGLPLWPQWNQLSFQLGHLAPPWLSWGVALAASVWTCIDLHLEYNEGRLSWHIYTIMMPLLTKKNMLQYKFPPLFWIFSTSAHTSCFCSCDSWTVSATQTTPSKSWHYYIFFTKLKRMF